MIRGVRPTGAVRATTGPRTVEMGATPGTDHPRGARPIEPPMEPLASDVQGARPIERRGCVKLRIQMIPKGGETRPMQLRPVLWVSSRPGGPAGVAMSSGIQIKAVNDSALCASPLATQVAADRGYTAGWIPAACSTRGSVDRRSGQPGPHPPVRSRHGLSFLKRVKAPR